VVARTGVSLTLVTALTALTPLARLCGGIRA